MAGISRSAAVVIAFLIRNNDMTLEQAFKHTQSIRPVVSPNRGFMDQLAMI